jgi:hypothetical protein
MRRLLVVFVLVGLLLSVGCGGPAVQTPASMPPPPKGPPMGDKGPGGGEKDKSSTAAPVSP